MTLKYRSFCLKLATSKKKYYFVTPFNTAQLNLEKNNPI